MVSVEGMEKIKNFVMEQVMEKNRCLVIGSEDLMDKFCEDNGIQIDYIMSDYLNIDNEIESEPAKIYNAKSGEVLLLALTNKDPLVNLITMSRKMAGIVEKDEENILLEHLLGVELTKNRYRDGFRFDAKTMCTSSEKEKIKMIDNIFRRPSEKTINEMRMLLEDRSIIETNRRFNQSVKYMPHGNPNESFYESLQISDKRAKELSKVTIKLYEKAMGKEKLAEIEDISSISHETFIDLLEKEVGINNREKLYIAFIQGIIMEDFTMATNDKFSSLEDDKDDKIKSIGKRYACEIRKSDTIIKIDNLKDLNMREKMKACLWAGIHNRRFYREDVKKC